MGFCFGGGGWWKGTGDSAVFRRLEMYSCILVHKIIE
jgi:hypothetical protein